MKNKSLTLTYEQAQFLLCAVTDLDLSKPAYKNLGYAKNVQHNLAETLRVLCWGFHYEEQEERERAFAQAQATIKRWPEFLKDLVKHESAHHGPHGLKCKCGTKKKIS